ncbi:MAG: hypothetical protein ABI054_13735 [Planctomycetota bacterium]
MIGAAAITPGVRTAIATFAGKGVIRAFALLDKGKSLAANDAGSWITVWTLAQK